MMMPNIHEMLQLLPPCLVGAAVLAAVFFSPWKKNPFLLDVAGAAAFAVALVWGYKRLVAWPEFPPIQSTQRLIFAIGVAAVFAVAESPLWRKPAIAPIARIPAILLLLAWMFETPAKTWSVAESAKWYGISALAMFSWWWVIKELAAKHSGIVLLALSATAGTLGLVTGSYGGAVLGQLAGTLAMMCGCAVPFVFAVPRAAIGRGAVAVIAVTIFGIVFNGLFYLIDPPPFRVYLLLAAAPLAVGCARLPLLTRKWPRLAGPIGLILCLSIVLGAFVAAKNALPAPVDNPYADLYGDGK